MNRRSTRMGDDGVMDLEGSLSQLNKDLSKLDRMANKIGTPADNTQFRDLLAAERKSATHLTKQIVEHLKVNRIRGVIVGQVEREYQRFTTIVAQIDLKQKQQICTIAQREHNPQLAEEILREERAAGRSESFQSNQLTAQEANIEFLEYNVDEIAQRHQQIRQIEHDIGEMAGMWKDLQTLVDEQQVHIDIIDTAVSETKSKVEKAHQELESAAEYQRKARKKACCSAVFLVVILAVIVIVVLALKGKI